MNQELPEPISISLIFDHNQRKTCIKKVFWRKKIYEVTKHGLHHTYKKGDTTYHVFSVSSDTISFKIVLNGTSLIWNLEEFYDQNFK